MISTNNAVQLLVISLVITTITPKINGLVIEVIG